MDQYFELLDVLFERHGPYIVFPILLLENFPFVGFFAPAITLLILAGFSLAFQPDLLALTSVVALAAILTGDNIWFLLGRRSGGRWPSLRRVNTRAGAVLEVIAQQPKWVLYLYQFPPYFRMFLPFGLGMAQYGLRQWAAINLAGSVLYTAFFVSLGAGARYYLATMEDAQQLGEYVSYAIVVFAVAYAVVLVSRYRRKRQGAAVDREEER